MNKTLKIATMPRPIVSIYCTVFCSKHVLTKAIYFSLAHPAYPLWKALDKLQFSKWKAGTSTVQILLSKPSCHKQASPQRQKWQSQSAFLLARQHDEYQLLTTIWLVCGHEVRRLSSWKKLASPSQLEMLVAGDGTDGQGSEKPPF